MNVIKSCYNLLPKHWQDWIATEQWFSLNQFSSTVYVQFEDGSHCLFMYAFVVEDKERRELAVFTEHSGYYVFPNTDNLSWTVMKVTQSRPSGN